MMGAVLNRISTYAGFADTVQHAQLTFRAVLEALSRPGTVQRVVAPAEHPAELETAEAALLLTLADGDAAPWLAGAPLEAAAYCRFHCGVSPLAAPEQARFAFLLGASPLPLTRFNAGEAELPEQAATLIVRVPALQGGARVQLSGPGIETFCEVAPRVEPAFWAAWQHNRAAYPLGVDVLLVAGDQVMGLPRGTRAAVLEEA
jgi:alpha-D-ribose 1-methylphosphonate 5-triphosphate synthase subunit PhnH